MASSNHHGIIFTHERSSSWPFLVIIVEAHRRAHDAVKLIDISASIMALKSTGDKIFTFHCGNIISSSGTLFNMPRGRCDYMSAGIVASIDRDIVGVACGAAASWQ